MKRRILVTVIVSAAMVGLVLAWNTVRRDREFHRLIAQGDASLASNQTLAAVEAFSGALALKPDSMIAHLKRGNAYYRRAEHVAALRDLREAVLLDPSATRPREVLGDVNAALERFPRAIEAYHAYLAIDDRSPPVLYKLALAYFRAGQPAEAIQPLRQALALNERIPEAHYLLGMCTRTTKPVAAIRSLSRAVELNPTFAAAREALSDTLTSIGRTREGFEELEALAAMEPAHPERAVAIGLAYARLGRTDAAILKLSRIAEQYPDAPMVYAALGRVWLEIAETRSDRAALSKALGALQASVSDAAATSESLALYGRALFLTGDRPQAARYLELATTRMPVEPLAYLYLSIVAERLGRPAPARDALVSYVSLADDDTRAAGYASRIADLSLQMNDAPTAVTWARRAVQAATTDETPLGLLADALWRTGRREEGRAMLALALQHDPRNPNLRRLQRRFAAS